MMKPRALLPLMAVLAAAPISAATPALTIEPRVLTTRLEGELSIDPTGAVESYHVLTDVAPGLAGKVEAMVRQLRFEPVELDGRPARAHTRMRVTLAGTPLDDDGLNVRLDNIGFPDSKKGRPDDEYIPGLRMKVDRRSMPDYPVIAARAGVDADVLVIVKVGRDGRIADAAIRQSALIAAGGEPEAVAKLLSEFEYQSLRAVRRWHVAVDVDPGFQPTDAQMTALVPIVYRMQERTPPRLGDWVWETRSQKREAPWIAPDPARPTVGVADVGGADDLLRGEDGFRLAASSQQAL